MRYSFQYSIMFLFLFSCSLQASNYEKAIIDFLQTRNGVTTDLKISFISLDVSDIKAIDSLNILIPKYIKEKNKKIEKVQETVNFWLSRPENKNEVINNKRLTSLTKAKERLAEAKVWKPDCIKKYELMQPDKVIAKKADCKLSFYNPRLQTRQELKAIFILSPDGKQCIKMIK